MLSFIDIPTNKHGERAATRPTLLIIHSMGLPVPTALELLTRAPREVSCHYAIAPDGKIYRMVPEGRRAWHAGKSSWRGQSDINSASIGIELICPGEGGRERTEEEVPGPFPEVQIEALFELVEDIVLRHGILPEDVLAHSDIAPGRKRDPGELFPWHAFSKTGVALWPRRPYPLPSTGDLAPLLQRYGYDVSDPPAAVIAFQRHFRPRDCKGIADSETRSILEWLLQKTKR